MLKKVLIIVAAAVAVLCIAISLQPSELRVTRSTTFTAPPAAVFVQVNNLHNWEAWSPWVKLDPHAKTSYAGPPAGVGASFTWSGNTDVGAGTMTITDSAPNERVRFKIDFVKPMAGTNIAEFAFKPQGNQTTVTWTMSGEKNFIAKAMGLVIDCDKMIGDQFEKGFAQMKPIVEAAPKT